MTERKRDHSGKSAREHAAEILQRVETKKAYANLLLNDLQNIQENIRPLLTQIVKGTLEWQLYLDERLQKFLRMPIAKMNPWLRVILRLGAYEVLFLTNIPKEVSVNEAVNLAKKYAGGAKSGALANAVLRKIAAEPAITSSLDNTKSVASAFSHPEWIVALWAEQLGLEQAKELCKANNMRATQCLRANTLKLARADLIEKLAKAGVHTGTAKFHVDCLYVTSVERGVSITKLQEFREGLFTIQDESSALVTAVLDAAPGDFLIDLCSAPGGKAAAAAAAMANEGTIIAVDPHPNRLTLVRSLASRLGISCIHPVAADGTVISFNAPANKVLVDAPCSGLGTLGHKADVRWNKSEADLSFLQKLQTRLLSHAAELVVRGGLLVYSTCTINRGENEDIIHAFLENNADFSLVDLPSRIPSTIVTREGFMQTLPHRDGISGAFAGLIRRN